MFCTENVFSYTSHFVLCDIECYIYDQDRIFHTNSFVATY